MCESNKSECHINTIVIDVRNETLNNENGNPKVNFCANEDIQVCNGNMEFDSASGGDINVAIQENTETINSITPIFESIE